MSYRRSALFLSAAACLGFRLSAFGQVAACGDVLRYAGVSWETKTDNEKVDSAVSFFCSKRFESSQEAQSAITNAGFAIDAIPYSFGGDFSNENFQRRQEQICYNAQTFSLSRSRGLAVIKQLDDNVTRAVGDCLRLQANGLFVWIEQSTDPQVFKVHMSLRGSTVPAIIEDFAVVPSTVTCTQPLNGSFLLDRETVCTRDQHTVATVTLNSTNFAKTWVGSSSLPAKPQWTRPECNSVYLKQPYTTEGDTRVSKNLSCPAGMVVIPNSGRCLRTSEAFGVLRRSEAVGDTTWVCEWDSQPVGVGIWAEVGCQCR